MRARGKNRLRSVRASLNRFLSILFIVALGSGFLAGLLAASPDMFETVDHYMDRHRWYDLDIKGLLGLTEEDGEALKELPETETVQLCRTADVVLKADADTGYTSRIFAILDEKGETALNGFELLEGRMPEARGECAVQSTMGRYLPQALKPGDTLTYSPEETDDGQTDQMMTERELTIVGFCRSPMSISVEADASSVGSGSISLLVFAREELLESDVYTDAFVTLTGAAAEMTFGDSYESLRNAAVEAMEPLAAERGRLRAETVRKQAEDRIRTARELADLLEKTEERKKALAADMTAREEQRRTAADLLRSAGAGALAESLEGTVPREAEEIPLLKKVRTDLSDAEELLSDLPEENWLIRSREDSAGFVSYRSNVEKVSALSRVFPVFFFLVALLVALTTMTRLVEENRKEIGTMKALGYSDGNIWSEYLSYAFGASVLGCVLGLAAGFRLFPAAIAGAYSMMYVVPETETPFRPDLAVLVAPVTVAGIMVAAFWACRSELRVQPAAMMIPKAPPAGKRIFLERIPWLWRRLSFTRKVTCRNLFRYKKRFVMTVIGVAGCSALLLTGFGLRDSINDIVGRQFGDIYRYELTLVLDREDAAETDGQLRSFLTDGRIVSEWIPFASGDGKILKGSEGRPVSVSVPGRTEDFDRFVTLRERRSGGKLELEPTGAVLTEKLCEQLGISAGDTVTLENAEGRRAEVKVTGITENYLTSFAYLSPEAWRAAFGREPEYTTLLCRRTDPSLEPEQVTRKAMASEHVVYASDIQSLKDSFADSIRSIDAVVLVLILAAGMLSVVVLYNLTNVNICERRKELATISVLGFFPREVERYIFRETNVLSFIGSVAGLFVGIWLHAFVVQTVEVDAVMFGRSVYPLSYVWALLISMAFTLLVNQLMKRQIRKVDMVEAMKAND